MRLIMLLVGGVFSTGTIMGILKCYNGMMNTTGINGFGYFTGFYFLTLGFLPIGLLIIYIAIRRQI